MRASAGQQTIETTLEEQSDVTHFKKGLLRCRFEWYQARAAAAQPDEKEPGVDTVSPDVSGAPLTDALWCFKYRPLSSQEVRRLCY